MGREKGKKDKNLPGDESWHRRGSKAITNQGNWEKFGVSAALLASEALDSLHGSFPAVPQGGRQPRTGSEQQLGDQTLQKKENHSDSP